MLVQLVSVVSGLMFASLSALLLFSSFMCLGALGDVSSECLKSSRHCICPPASVCAPCVSCTVREWPGLF